MLRETTGIGNSELFGTFYTGQISEREGEVYQFGQWGERGVVEIDPAALAKPIVSVIATDGLAGEIGDAGQLVVSRVGSLEEDLTVNFAIAGDGTNGADYQTLENTVTIPAGETVVSVPVLALADEVLEEDESIEVTLEDGDYEIGFKAIAAVTVRDAGKLSVYGDRGTFLANTGATGSSPFRHKESTHSFQLDNLTFTAAPYTFSRAKERTELFPGKDLASNGVESFDVDLAEPVYSFGFDFLEPEFLPGRKRTICRIKI